MKSCGVSIQINETSPAVLSHGIICFYNILKMKGILLSVILIFGTLESEMAKTETSLRHVDEFGRSRRPLHSDTLSPSKNSNIAISLRQTCVWSLSRPVETLVLSVQSPSLKRNGLTSLQCGYTEQCVKFYGELTFVAQSTVC